MFVEKDPLGNPVDQRHPWNQTTIPEAAASATSRATTAGSCRRAGTTSTTGDHLALDTGGGPIARLLATALAGLVDIGYIKATGTQRQDLPAQDGLDARGRVRVEDPEVEQRDRARPGPHLLPGLCGRLRALLRRTGACRSCTPAAPRPGASSRCPTRRSAAASTRRCAGVLSHHVVIRDGKIANYHPYPPTPWNANSA